MLTPTETFVLGVLFRGTTYWGELVRGLSAGPAAKSIKQNTTH